MGDAITARREQGFCGLDLQFARFLARVSGDASAELFLAAALTSSARGRGNICIDLSAGAAAPGEAGMETVFDGDALIRVLEKSPAVGRPGDYRPLILDGARLYLYRYWEYEHELAQELQARAAQILSPEMVPLKERIDRLFPRGSLGQKRAAVLAALKPLLVIAGGPGTGKTSAVARTLALLIEQAGGGGNFRAALAAPTGKAAARMQESIRAEIDSLDCAPQVKAAIPAEASTVHRLLGWGPRGFRFSREHRLDLDALVIDEASMVDLALLSRLVQALPAACRIVLIGDRDQLASVEAGAALGDICGRDGQVPYSRKVRQYMAGVLGREKSAPGPSRTGMGDCISHLDESFRFGAASAIGSLARAVNAGNAPGALESCDAGIQARWHDLPGPRKIAAALRGPVLECFGPLLRSAGPEDALHKMNSFRFLCAVREGYYGVSNINESVKEILRSEGLIFQHGPHYKGCPVMVTSNNYSLNLYNGDVGIIWPDPQSAGQLRAFFPAAQGTRSFPLFSLPGHEVVYAMTVHKSQGSEFDRVLLVLPDRDTPLLTRELIYTAVTRAREQVTIWGKKEVFSTAISRRIERSSGLRESLWGKC